jgi:epoxyqueuosine reductase
MNMATCVSRLTTSNDAESYDDITNRQIGTRMYGCDVCQDVCPMNKDTWEHKDIFPDLSNVSSFLSPAAILDAGYEEIEHNLMTKFFYIKKESLWRWKLNAINALVNTYQAGDDLHIRHSLDDTCEIVRKKAQWALEKIAARKKHPCSSG